MVGLTNVLETTWAAYRQFDLFYRRLRHPVAGSLVTQLCFWSPGGLKLAAIFWLFWADFDLHLSWCFEGAIFTIFLCWFELWPMLWSSKLTKFWPPTDDPLSTSCVSFWPFFVFGHANTRVPDEISEHAYAQGFSTIPGFSLTRSLSTFGFNNKKKLELGHWQHEHGVDSG